MSGFINNMPLVLGRGSDEVKQGFLVGLLKVERKQHRRAGGFKDEKTPIACPVYNAAAVGHGQPFHMFAVSGDEHAGYIIPFFRFEGRGSFEISEDKGKDFGRR